MKRVILQVPEGLTFDMLSELQQQAIKQVFGQYVNPMPGTIPSGGFQMVDALTIDSFDPALMVDFNITWPIVGISQWDGQADHWTVIQPLNVDIYKSHSADGTMTEHHRWAGHPEGAFNFE